MRHPSIAVSTVERTGSRGICAALGAGAVRFSPDKAEKADIPVRRRPLINCGTDRASRDSTRVLVQSCSVPKAIEFFLDPPSDQPPAGSKLVETLEVGGALGSS